MTTRNDKTSRQQLATVAALALTLTLGACGGLAIEAPQGGVTLPDAPPLALIGFEQLEPLAQLDRGPARRSLTAEAAETEIAAPEPGCGPYAGPCDAAAGFVCVKGFCACKAGLLRCADGCVDLNNDPLNCGGCRRSCKSNQCINGTCGGGR